MYQKVWPVLGAHAGAKKTHFLPDFGPDFFIRPSFTNSCATLGINQTPPNEASLTGALCLYFASIDGCPLFARTSFFHSPPVPSPLSVAGERLGAESVRRPLLGSVGVKDTDFARVGERLLHVRWAAANLEDGKDHYDQEHQDDDDHDVHDDPRTTTSTNTAKDFDDKPDAEHDDEDDDEVLGRVGALRRPRVA